MPKIFKPAELEYTEMPFQLEQYKWKTSPRLSDLAGSKHLFFNVRSLEPGKYSFPYHFHRNSEELFVIFSGTATLRTPEGLQIVEVGDIIFFELNESGAHQLFNHTNEPCLYLDLRTNFGIDICEYPDSRKINVLPNQTVFEQSTKVDYLKGEDKIDEIWNQLRSEQKGNSE
jgi:uncharacterized cupin superfamily protein